MLGELIAQLDRPDVADDVLATLDPEISELLHMRAYELDMSPGDFASGAMREFIETADDDLWFQLLTHIREAEDPGLAAVQTVLAWVVTEKGQQ